MCSFVTVASFLRDERCRMPVITSLVLVALLLVEVETKWICLVLLMDSFLFVCLLCLRALSTRTRPFVVGPCLKLHACSLKHRPSVTHSFIDLTFSFPFPFLLVPCLRLLGHLVLVCRSIGHDRRNDSLVSCGPRSESWVLLFEHPRDPGPFLPCR